METMPLLPGWGDLALRLLLTVLAGALIGWNRGEHGHPAGLRTTLLVALAAAITMIEVNLLLPMAGKAPDSFITNDLMRLPLGILSGMGFIGAGAILRRGNLVQGITTAATLWLTTVIGLCFGGGQLQLGTVATILCLATLWGLKWVERRLRLERHASLALTLEPDVPAIAALRSRFGAAGFDVRLDAIAVAQQGWRQLEFGFCWHGGPETFEVEALMGELAAMPGVLAASWRSGAAPPV